MDLAGIIRIDPSHVNHGKIASAGVYAPPAARYIYSTQSETGANTHDEAP